MTERAKEGKKEERVRERGKKERDTRQMGSESGEGGKSPRERNFQQKSEKLAIKG